MSYGGSGYEQNDERVSDVLSQETIREAIERDAAMRAARQGNPSAGGYSQQSSTGQRGASSYEPDRPGIARRDTTSRRDPLTGDLVEEYSGSDPNGPGIRAHHNWDEPGKAPTNIQQQQSSYSGSSQEPRPGDFHRTNTTISYNSSGDRVEEHDGEGSLRVRALYNEDDEGNTYRPPPPGRHQSERTSRDHY